VDVKQLGNSVRGLREIENVQVSHIINHRCKHRVQFRIMQYRKITVLVNLDAIQLKSHLLAMHLIYPLFTGPIFRYVGKNINYFKFPSIKMAFFLKKPGIVTRSAKITPSLRPSKIHLQDLKVALVKT
jgi:hypothetical protein